MLKDIASRVCAVKPASLFLILTQRCNARCNMCDIWRSGIGPGEEMTVDDYARVLADPLFSEILKATLSGGESLLREDVAQIIQVLQHSLPALSKITIASNGLATRLIIERVNEICRSMAASGRDCQLNVQVSCDGVSEVHDRIRGEGASRKVAATFKGLLELRARYDFLKLSSVCVIQPINIGEALAVSDYLRGMGVAPIFTCACFSETYYKNTEFEEIVFKEPQKDQVAAIMRELIRREDDLGKRALYREFAGMLAGGRNTRNCPTIRHIASISQSGQLFPCLNAMDVGLGNVLQESPSRLWFTRRRREELLRVKTERCGTCMFACGMGYIEVFNHNMALALGIDQAGKI